VSRIVVRYDLALGLITFAFSTPTAARDAGVERLREIKTSRPQRPVKNGPGSHIAAHKRRAESIGHKVEGQEIRQSDFSTR